MDEFELASDSEDAEREYCERRHKARPRKAAVWIPPIGDQAGYHACSEPQCRDQLPPHRVEFGQCLSCAQLEERAPRRPLKRL